MPRENPGVGKKVSPRIRVCLSRTNFHWLFHSLMYLPLGIGLLGNWRFLDLLIEIILHGKSYTVKFYGKKFSRYAIVIILSP